MKNIEIIENALNSEHSCLTCRSINGPEDNPNDYEFRFRYLDSKHYKRDFDDDKIRPSYVIMTCHGVRNTVDFTVFGRKLKLKLVFGDEYSISGIRFLIRDLKRALELADDIKEIYKVYFKTDLKI